MVLFEAMEAQQRCEGILEFAWSSLFQGEHHNLKQWRRTNGVNEFPSKWNKCSLVSTLEMDGNSRNNQITTNKLKYKYQLDAAFQTVPINVSNWLSTQQ